MACLGGLCMGFYATSGNPIIGESYTQRSITAAVVGGAALAGGKGSVIGCIAAALILGIINNVLNLQGVSSYYQYVMQGAILIAALSLNALKRRK
ncbi:MAG: ABC transporter permease, partial [Ruthenibacterium sp.]